MSKDINADVRLGVISPRWRTAAAALAWITAGARVAGFAAWVLGTAMLATVAARVIGYIPASRGFPAGAVHAFAACGLASLAFAVACSWISAIPVPRPAARAAGSAPQQGQRNTAPDVLFVFLDFPGEDR